MCYQIQNFEISSVNRRLLNMANPCYLIIHNGECLVPMKELGRRLGFNDWGNQIPTPTSFIDFP